MKDVYGFVGPSSGSLTEPKRDVKVMEVVVCRINLEEYEGKKCPACSNLRDVLTVKIEKVETFYNCPCGHNWTKDCDCLEEVEEEVEADDASS